MNAQCQLSKEEVRRYSRHLTLPDVGVAGQIRLKNSGVLIIGAGGLGSPVAMYLAAAGVGRIGIVDMDVVEESNLQRQIMHSTERLNQSKVDSARVALLGINPLICVETYRERLNADNAFGIAASYDVIVDGTDNFSTRYLANDLAVLTGKPLVYGSIYRFDGQASVFWAAHGPCYRCVYPEPPPPELAPNCAEGGVIGVLPGMIGTIQASEAIKLVLQIGTSLIGRMLILDALSMQFRQLEIRKNPACPACGRNRTIFNLVESEQACSVNRPAVPVEGPVAAEITSNQLLDVIKNRKVILLDVRTTEEREICSIENSIHIPLQELTERIGEIDASTPVVVYCKSGMRSQKAAALLQQSGFFDCRSLKGGIAEWATTVEETMPTY